VGVTSSLLALLVAIPVGDDWENAWGRVAELEALREEDGDGLERMEVALTLLAECSSHPNDSRFQILAAWLDHEGYGRLPQEAGPLPDARGDANWLLADLLDDGPRRTESYAKALREGTHPPATVWLQQAWEYGVRCAREHLWLDDAVVVQRELHAIYGEAWSAMNLAGSLHRAGRVDEADAVLAAQEALGANPAEIQNTRGIHALGRGDERAARDHLGRSLARGYRDSALVLARLDQTRGDLPGARAGFRALLHVDPSAGETPHAWALRGWGMTLLSPEDR
jgi:hypothetical protein